MGKILMEKIIMEDIMMEEIVMMYYMNNAKKLHTVVDKILSRFGGLSDKDMDDFYSLANEVFVDVINRYDNSQEFDTFLYVCLSNRIRSEITRRNRKKREIDRLTVSIDMPVSEDESVALVDTIADSYDIEKEVLEEKEEKYSRKMLMYFSKLSTLQHKVLKMSVEGYHPDEIKEELHISDKQYTDCSEAIHSYRNISVLF